MGLTPSCTLQCLQRAVHAARGARCPEARRADMKRGSMPSLSEPHREPRQPAGARRAERGTVVGAHRIGQADLAEHPFQRSLARRRASAAMMRASMKIAARRVR